MKGRNRLCLNKTEMKRAVQCYLDRILTIGENVEVEWVHQDGDRFLVDMIEKKAKPNATK